MAVEIFTRDEFESALKSWHFTHLGVMQKNHAYRVDFGNPHCHLVVYSSIAPSGQSRTTAEDSIRVWIRANNGKPVGGKTQKYVTRVKGWQDRLNAVITKVVNLGRWIQPCPKCGTLLALKVNNENAFVFCPHDIGKKDDRHLKLIVLDETGEQKAAS